MEESKRTPALTAFTGLAAMALALAAEPASAATAGPDLFGYTAADEEEASVDYAWVDMSGGTDLAPLMGDGSCSAAIPLGFSFHFYGKERTEAYLLSNGTITFDPFSGWALLNQCPLPNAVPPNDMIAFYGHDFDPSSTACTDCHMWWASGGTSPDRWWGVTF